MMTQSCLDTIPIATLAERAANSAEFVDPSVLAIKALKLNRKVLFIGTAIIGIGIAHALE